MEGVLPVLPDTEPIRSHLNRSFVFINPAGGVERVHAMRSTNVGGSLYAQLELSALDAER